MKALVWTGPRRLEILERPVPVPERCQVLIRSRAAGLCGTDVHLFEGAFAPAVPPLIPGHEAAGVVARVHEDDAMPFRMGDRVVVNPNIGCGRCRYCLKGKAHHCADRRIIGLAGWDGGLADYFLAPAANVFVVPNAVSWLDAACMDNLANAIHGLDLVPERTGETVAVFGCGASGLCFIQLCRWRGASRIIAVDMRRDRLEWAERFGAESVVDAGHDDPAAAIRALTDGVGVDLAIEASGSLAGPIACLQSAATGGSILIFGVYEKPVDGVDFQDQHRREITIYGSTGAPDTFQRAVDLVSEQKIRLAPMVTDRVQLEQVSAVLSGRMQPSHNDLKTIVMVSEDSTI